MPHTNYASREDRTVPLSDELIEEPEEDTSEDYEELDFNDYEPSADDLEDEFYEDDDSVEDEYIEDECDARQGTIR